MVDRHFAVSNPAWVSAPSGKAFSTRRLRTVPGFTRPADEDVSYKSCAALVQKRRANGGNVEIKLYVAATHSFDAPSRKRQRVETNSSATEYAFALSQQFF